MILVGLALLSIIPCTVNIAIPVLLKFGILLQICTMFNDPTISIATANDIPGLLALVNSAYRGEAAKKGWTHEADLIAGEVRTDEASILKMIQTRGAVFLICRDGNNILIG